MTVSSQPALRPRNADTPELAAKSRLRKTLLARRNRLSTHSVDRLSQSALERFWRLRAIRDLDRRRHGQQEVWMSCYVDFDHEVQTRTLLRKALVRGYKVAVPVVFPESNAGLMLSEVSNVPGREDPGPGWVRSSFGLVQPCVLKPVDPSEMDCFVIPGLGFDRCGFRLGFGKGYYDQLLGAVRSEIPRIALAFSLQVVDQLPRDPWDVPMHRVVTEKGVIRCPTGTPSSHFCSVQR